MRSFVVALFLGLVAATVPLSASALQVDITYTLNGVGASNSGPFLGGNTPTGGTATVRWGMTSINGVFTAGPGSIIFLSITAAVSGGYTLTVSPWSWASPGSIYSAGNKATTIFGGHPQFSEYAKIFANLTQGSFSFFGSLNGDPLQVFGAEVGGGTRSVVPEPSSAALLALGLFGVAAGRTAWRRKGRRSA